MGLLKGRKKVFSLFTGLIALPQPIYGNDSS
jgi:hypothetical protein